MIGITILTLSIRFLIVLFTSAISLNAGDSHRDCLILIDSNTFDYDQEGITRFSNYLMSRLQSALAEEAVPILLNASLWNAFNEHSLNFERYVHIADSKEHKIFNLYHTINKRISYWSAYYNALSRDSVHNKQLVVQQINNEFYIPSNKHLAINEWDHQRFLCHATKFDDQKWSIYTDNGCFYLLIPKKYAEQHATIGFNIDTLQEVQHPQDTAYTYFVARNNQSLADVLPHFFLTYDNMYAEMPYAWNIVFAGHGGGFYKEQWNDNKLTWSGEPLIANMPAEEFRKVLEFFNTQVKTHLFHYSCCYGGGSHTSLIFGEEAKRTYNFAIMCGNLTDCLSYCKWAQIVAPSAAKQFLVPSDITHNAQKDCWELPLAPEYCWKSFFNAIATIDFSVASIELLPKILWNISYSFISSIPLLCLPGTDYFYSLHTSGTFKLDDRMLALAQGKDDHTSLTLPGCRLLLLESTQIAPTIILNQTDTCRFVSIAPGKAIHYLKKLKADFYIHLPSAFWQVEYQFFDKIFLIDECTFPQEADSLLFKDSMLITQNSTLKSKNLKLKNLLIIQQKWVGMRIFFTHNDTAFMVVADKTDELDTKTVIKLAMPLTTPARSCYEAYYDTLRQKTSLGNEADILADIDKYKV